MIKKFFSYWLNKRYPQNILIRKPLIGTLFFLIFCIFFVIIYKPLDVHESRFLNMEMTVAAYFIIASFPLFGIVKLLKTTKYFSDPEECFRSSLFQLNVLREKLRATEQSFEYRENVFALYGNIVYKLDKIEMNGGLRAEMSTANLKMLRI